MMSTDAGRPSRYALALLEASARDGNDELIADLIDDVVAAGAAPEVLHLLLPLAGGLIEYAAAIRGVTAALVRGAAIETLAARVFGGSPDG